MPKKLMIIICAVNFLLTVTMTLLYCFLDAGVFLTLAITFGTIFYHLGIRLLIGLLFQFVVKNRADYKKRWYHVHAWEHKLYKFLRVGK